MRNIWFAIFWIMIGVGIGFLLGGFSPKNSSDETNNKTSGSVKGTYNQPTDNFNNANIPQNISAKINIESDPYLGDKNKAKIAIVEFSDFECPFCQKFHRETFDELVKQYVDTNKAITVYKDFPLDFHNPAATIDANAAECVNELAGRKKYFQMVKLIYQNTGSNGLGISEEKFIELASGIGVDKGKFVKCFKESKFAKEINNDLEEGKSIGIDGTPGFVIGKLSANGEVEGVILSGAQPYSVFKQIIESELNKL